MAIFYLKNRDTLPILEVALKNSDGTAYDLTGATGWKLHVRLRSGSTISRNMVVQGPAANGVLRYTFLAADWSDPTTPLVAGQHRMEYEVIGPGVARISFPSDSYDELRIIEDLGQA